MSRQRSIHTIECAEFVTIGELVRLTGVRYSTLKFYTEQGILPFEQTEQHLTRRYCRVLALRRISEVKKMRALGLSIQDIKQRLVSSEGEGL